MKFGFCTGIDFGMFRLLGEAGFDYVELPLNGVATHDDIPALKKALRAARLPVLACNLFFPPTLQLAGAARDPAGIEAYLEKALPLAADLGVETLVFGNGGLRRIPEGETRETTRAHLRDLAERMEKHAARASIQIGVEPLNATETDMILSYGEAVALSEGLTYVAAIVDSYHVLMEEQDYADVLRHPSRLFHAHTAYSKKRRIPSPNDDASEYAPFVHAIKSIGYNNKISIEGRLRGKRPIEEELAASLRAIKFIFGQGCT